MDAARAALLVGIDDYVAKYRRLKGAVADVRSLELALKRNSADASPNFTTRQVIGDSDEEMITAKTIQDGIEELLREETEVSWFHFSGHGVAKPLGENSVGSLVAQDGSEFRLSDLSAVLAESRARQTVVTLDCCYSGAAGIESLVGPDFAVVPRDCVILSASRPDEPAYEGDGSGLFTSSLVSGLEGAAADLLGRVTLAALYNYVDEMFPIFGQRPMLRANVSSLLRLTMCEPPIERKILQELPQIFGQEDSVYPLDPSYEPTSPEEVKLEANCERFARLQKAAAARLVVPVGEDHMYFAAMNSTGCRLTPLGKRYHYLAKTEQI